jgi:hypothetical protein
LYLVEEKKRKRNKKKEKLIKKKEKKIEKKERLMQPLSIEPVTSLDKMQSGL